MQYIRKSVLIFFSLVLFSTATFAHGVIESPASREQFCGVESKPHEIFQDKMTHEKCRPIMTKADGTMDNSIYNFMAVLTHTIGRSTKPIDQLPKNVCGFNSEMWGGGKTPWDSTIDWPTNLIKSGPQKFTWNISWGNHFGDTEEFVYWITKPDFQFQANKELTWDDFEATPFCHLRYNDQSPTANPNIVADKANNRFITTCNVPERKNRSIIYGEWGRTSSTYERFHSCIDVEFGADTNPPVNIKAVINPLPSEVTGPVELQLDASNSVGSNLSYNWSIDAENLTPYQLHNSQSAKARLFVSNINAQQNVTVNLTVQQGQATNRVHTQFVHLPAAVATWKTVGRATLDSTLKGGDKIQLRLIDNAGKDYFFPATPVVLTDDTARADTWAYTLAQGINSGNQFSAMIGILGSDNKTIQPIKSATENMIFVPINSTIVNGYIQVQKDEPIQSCLARRNAGSSSYWLGYDVSADSTPIVLNFSATGIDLTKVIIDHGVFSNVQVLDKDRLLINTKPEWVSKTTSGYLAFYGQNYGPNDAFNSPINATCQINNIFKKK